MPLSPVSIYPNPTVDKAHIQFSVYEKTVLRLEVFSPAGKLTHHWPNAMVAPGDYTYKLNVKHLPPGAYTVKLSGQGHSLTNTFLRVRD